LLLILKLGQLFTDASALIVLAARTDVDASFVDTFVKSVSDTRGMDVAALAGYADMMKGSIAQKGPAGTIEWSARQVYIALGTALAAAATMEVDACPMEGFDNAKFDEILGLKAQNLTSAVCLAVGFRSPEDASASYKKVRFSKEEVVITA
jgi:nitroreductase